MSASIKNRPNRQNIYIKISEAAQNNIQESNDPSTTVTNVRHYQTDLFSNFNTDKVTTSRKTRLRKNQINVRSPEDVNRDSTSSEKTQTNKFLRMDAIPLRKSKTQEEQNQQLIHKKSTQTKNDHKEINVTMKRNLEDKMRRVLQKIQEMNDCLNYRKEEKKIILERETASTRSMRTLVVRRDLLN